MLLDHRSPEEFRDERVNVPGRPDVGAERYGRTELLGYTDVKSYDGSWTEWGSMVGMPIER